MIPQIQEITKSIDGHIIVLVNGQHITVEELLSFTMSSGVEIMTLREENRLLKTAFRLMRETCQRYATLNAEQKERIEVQQAKLQLRAENYDQLQAHYNERGVEVEQLHNVLSSVEREATEQAHASALIETSLRRSLDDALSRLSVAGKKLIEMNKRLTTARDTNVGLLGIINGNSPDSAKVKALRIVTAGMAAENKIG